MKTRKQKVICRVLCMVVSIFLLASFFVFSVNADTMTDSTFIQNVDSTSTSRFRYRVGVSNLTALNNLTYSMMPQAANVELPGPEAIEYGFTLSSASPVGAVLYIADGTLVGTDETHNYKTGDTCFVKSGYIAVSSSSLNITGYRLTLRRYIPSAAGDPEVRFGPVVATTQQVNQKINGTISHEQLALTFLQDVTVDSLVLCLELSMSNFTAGAEIVIFLQNQFIVSYGAGKDPNYPIYPAAPGGNDVGNYGSAEQELIQSQEQGLSQGADSMQSAGSNLQSLSSDLKLMSFVPVLSGALDKIATIPGIMPLVNISLSLGLFASLMGLAASIVSAADRRAGQAKREAAAKERSDYYKSRQEYHASQIAYYKSHMG